MPGIIFHGFFFRDCCSGWCFVGHFIFAVVFAFECALLFGIVQREKTKCAFVCVCAGGIACKILPGEGFI